ncbi:MAG: septum formation initiator family protein [Enterobacterales bacterium]|nr:septum formation initiator family protein [Enterobacterales bacterium]
MRKLLAIILIILILWLQYRIWFGANSQQKLDQINQQIIQQQQQLKQLKKINRELQYETILLRNDPDILEEKAREKNGNDQERRNLLSGHCRT